VKLSLSVTAAQLDAQTHNVQQAARSLATSLQDAKRMKMSMLQLEIRLASAEIDPGRGAALTALEHDASSSGYLLVAAQAEHLQESPAH
jgi:hypothetical protein